MQPFGKYFLIRKLAEGGMAEIFLAKQVGAEGFERNVVIKRMLKHLTEVPDFVEMFLDEARLAARLAHQNIIQINDLGQADDYYYICMEYLPGEDFSTVLRTAGRQRSYVPLRVSLRVIADAAYGLQFAHDFTDERGRPLNIVHRDISPSNIYVTYQGQVKLLDFGIAKAESRVAKTTAGRVKGKYMYMSPEQAQGLPVDRRADVFSLGVSLYEALTSVRPFSRDNDLAILNAVLKNEFIPPRELRPDLPLELEAVVLKAMAARVEDRYQTTAEMAAELEMFLAGTTSSSGGKQVATYMHSLFGDEQVARKSRIPTLVSLTKGAIVPGKAGATEIKTDVSDPAMVAAGRSPGAAPRKGLSRMQWLAVGGIALGLVSIGGAYLFFDAQREQAPAPVPQAAAPVSPPAVSVPSVPPVVAVPSPAPVVAAPVAAEQPRPVRRSPPPKPVKLDAEGIRRVVNAGSGPIMKCFESYKKQLPSTDGTVTVTFTILGSGTVTRAATAGALKGTQVGRCLEERVTALRFPPHLDKEISLGVPFAYHIR